MAWIYSGSHKSSGCIDHFISEQGKVGFVAVISAPASNPERNDEAARCCRLMAAAPELLEVARIEHELHLGGYTRQTAAKLGVEALEIFRIAGAYGLNSWRREKRMSAIAKAEGALSSASEPSS